MKYRDREMQKTYKTHKKMLSRHEIQTTYHRKKEEIRKNKEAHENTWNTRHMKHKET